METIFVAPGKYVQGCGLLNQAGDYVKEYGDKCLIMADELVLNLIKEPLINGLEKSGLKTYVEVFSGECCRSEIERLSNMAKKFGDGCSHSRRRWEGTRYGKGSSL